MERKPYVRNDDIYHRGSRDPMFHYNNFLHFYEKLVNWEMVKTDVKAYKELLSKVGSIVKDVDFHQNILFIGKEGIQREIFLRGLSTFEDLTSFYYCNLLEIVDIWWGNKRKENVRVEDDDMMYSEQDIKQSVLCMLCDSNMLSYDYDRYVTSLISSRDGKRGYNGKPLYNWIYFRGTQSDMESLRGFADILKMYTANKYQGYSIIDLNKDADLSDAARIIEKSGKEKQSRQNNKPIGNSLSDIY